MAAYVMLGKYSADALQTASAERTREAKALVAKFRGRIKSVFALQGNYDLLVHAEFPGTEAAMKASIALTRLTGIGFASYPAVPVDRFDRMLREI